MNDVQNSTMNEAVHNVNTVGKYDKSMYKSALNQLFNMLITNSTNNNKLLNPRETSNGLNDAVLK